ncbi:glutathione S-transferase C-terminal domain-containing protein [Robbsia andropogonis]|uniref:glutathione S-transferase C-terminal domain-containing protein n=1 Tax=Robbsia andropogonis TaxID=28092 RepID=UPI0021B463F1|nr:glutathione S-transferase C-terminal domain-containing protein [Robbsia andropogonis]
MKTELERLDRVVEEGMSRFGGPWICGTRFTACDAFLAPFAFRAQSYAVPLKLSTRDYLDRLLELKSMRDWACSALLDPWRESSHEAELSSAGETLADLRGSAVPWGHARLD